MCCHSSLLVQGCVYSPTACFSRWHVLGHLYSVMPVWSHDGSKTLASGEAPFVGWMMNPHNSTVNFLWVLWIIMFLVLLTSKCMVLCLPHLIAGGSGSFNGLRYKHWIREEAFSSSGWWAPTSRGCYTPCSHWNPFLWRELFSGNLFNACEAYRLFLTVSSSKKQGSNFFGRGVHSTVLLCVCNWPLDPSQQDIHIVQWKCQMKSSLVTSLSWSFLISAMQSLRMWSRHFEEDTSWQTWGHVHNGTIWMLTDWLTWSPLLANHLQATK